MKSTRNVAATHLPIWPAFRCVDVRTLSFCRASGICRHNFTAYDAAYMALAEVLGAPLRTRDRRLAAAAGDLVPVELV